MSKSRNSLSPQNQYEVTTYQAGVAQARMHRQLQRRSDEILAPYGLSKMQWLIIGSTLDAGPEGIRVSDLAEKLGTTIPYLTTATNLLVSRQILRRVRNDQDSRSKLVTVAPSFAKKCPEIEETLREGLRRTIYAKISPEDFRVYLEVLQRLQDV